MLLGARQFFERRGAPAWQNPYVTDGLVAMWDGEWNAGPGVHDAATTTWQDLSEYANTASVVPSTATPIWGDKYFTMHSGATGFISGENSAYASLLTTPGCTYELVFEMLENLSRYAIVYVGGVATDIGLCTVARFGTRDFVSSSLRAKGYGALISRFETDGIDLANVMCYSCGQITQTGERVITRAVGLESDVSKDQSFGGIQYSDNKIGIGCGTSGGYTLGGAANIYSLRVYNRALTASEIARNYAKDKERFNLP